MSQECTNVFHGKEKRKTVSCLATIILLLLLLFLSGCKKMLLVGFPLGLWWHQWCLALAPVIKREKVARGAVVCVKNCARNRRKSEAVAQNE